MSVYISKIKNNTGDYLTNYHNYNDKKVNMCMNIELNDEGK